MNSQGCKSPKQAVIPLVLVPCLVLFLIGPGLAQTPSGPVQVGEPLHIFFRKDVPQEMLYLHFYQPGGNESISSLSSRFTLSRKGELNATVTLFFPRDINSNFLQFEPNGTLSATYQLVLFASTPLNASDNRASIELLIELDYQRDNEYDERFSTTVSFEANSTFVVVKGAMSMDPSALKKFDGQKGGKVRITLARRDDLDTNIVLQCGSSREPSFVLLPFSKYKYIPTQDDNGSLDPTVIFYVVGAVAAVLVVVLIIMERRRSRKVKGAIEEPPRRRRGSGRRGPGKRDST